MGVFALQCYRSIATRIIIGVRLVDRMRTVICVPILPAGNSHVIPVLLTFDMSYFMFVFVAIVLLAAVDLLSSLVAHTLTIVDLVIFLS